MIRNRGCCGGSDCGPEVVSKKGTAKKAKQATSGVPAILVLSGQGTFSSRSVRNNLPPPMMLLVCVLKLAKAKADTAPGFKAMLHAWAAWTSKLWHAVFGESEQYCKRTTASSTEVLQRCAIPQLKTMRRPGAGMC